MPLKMSMVTRQFVAQLTMTICLLEFLSEIFQQVNAGISESKKFMEGKVLRLIMFHVS